MCDTLYKRTENGFIFGKNSDRSPNEPNLTIYFPRKVNTTKTLKCTYIEIHQVPTSYACLLVKPSWMWGAEMGVNEFGVVIGNEAVFTKSKGKKVNRLLGMDLLRLALERSESAEAAMHVITELIEKYGQGGNCGFDKQFYYDNSFLICDASTAFILETSGKEWVTNKLTDFGNISNRLSIHDDYESSSDNNPVDFFKEHTEPIFTHFSGSFHRQANALCFLETSNAFSVETMMRALQSHEDENIKKRFSKGSLKSVCMHKSGIGDHTTSSMIVTSENKQLTIWLTSSSTPCLSLYKPVYFGVTGSVAFQKEVPSYDYWLRQELLRRQIFAGKIDEASYHRELNGLQAELIKEAHQINQTNPDKKVYKAFQSSCLEKEAAWQSKYMTNLTIETIRKNKVPSMWRHLNQRLGEHPFERTLEMRIQK